MINHDDPAFGRAECLHGSFLFRRDDTAVGRCLAIYGEWCQIEVGFLCGILRQGQTAIDVGANLGAHTVPLARRVGPSGQVVAIEPHPGNFALLQANIELNGLFNVRALPCAVGAEERDVRIEAAPAQGTANYGAFRVTADPSGHPVRQRRLDDLDMAACHLLKADTEGMEAEVVAGAKGLIARCRPYLYLENQESGSPLIAMLQDLDYALSWHPSLWVRSGNFRGVALGNLEGLCDFNLFGMPREAPPFRLPPRFVAVEGPADDLRTVMDRSNAQVDRARRDRGA